MISLGLIVAMREIRSIERQSRPLLQLDVKSIAEMKSGDRVKFLIGVEILELWKAMWILPVRLHRL